MDVFVDEIESGFHIGTKIQQSIAHLAKARRQTSRQLSEGDVELPPVDGIDHAENGLSLRQIQTPGQERAQRKLTRLCQPSTRRLPVSATQNDDPMMPMPNGQ